MDTLGKILPVLPENFPLPIVVVQHLHVSQDGFLCKYLNERCTVTVKETCDTYDTYCYTHLRRLRKQLKPCFHFFKERSQVRGIEYEYEQYCQPPWSCGVYGYCLVVFG